jgi:hypothetical protein
MPPLVSALLAFVVSLFQSRQTMHLRMLALQHQLAVYKQMGPRPCFCPAHRLFWAWLSRFWSGWHDALVFVQLRTVLAWQQKRFREHWKRLSQCKQPRRPAIPMSACTHTWPHSLGPLGGATLAWCRTATAAWKHAY